MAASFTRGRLGVLSRRLVAELRGWLSGPAGRCCSSINSCDFELRLMRTGVGSRAYAGAGAAPVFGLLLGFESKRHPEVLGGYNPDLGSMAHKGPASHDAPDPSRAGVSRPHPSRNVRRDRPWLGVERDLPCRVGAVAHDGHSYALGDVDTRTEPV